MSSFNDIALSASIRSNLLSLNNTQALANRTQGRLATGLKVASPIDNAFAYFAAQSLTTRGSDFSNKKSGIDQGISAISTGLDASTAINNLVEQAQGLAISLQTAQGAQTSALVVQFNILRTQINLLTTDATYQGQNLVNGSGQQLNISFSTLTTSLLSVSSVDITAGIKGLNIGLAQTGLGTYSIPGAIYASNESAAAITFYGFTGGIIGGQTVNVVISSGFILSSVNGGAGSGQVTGIQFAIGSSTFTANSDTFAIAGSLNTVFNDGTTFSFVVTSVAGAGNIASGLAFSAVKVLDVTGQFQAYSGVVTDLSFEGVNLQNALVNLRGKAAVLGDNVALLQTRLSFTSSYENELTGGAGKLTLADLNTEGANLVSLQTRQQLGIQSLSFAGQAEQRILTLFR